MWKLPVPVLNVKCLRHQKMLSADEKNVEHTGMICNIYYLVLTKFELYLKVIYFRNILRTLRFIMTLYECDMCEFSSKKKTDYTRHIERKIPCGTVMTNKELTDRVNMYNLDTTSQIERTQISGNIFDDIQNIKLSNVALGDHHLTQKNGNSLEKKLMTILNSYQFTKITIEPQVIRAKNYHHLQDGLYYINQPFGSQASPDFILVRTSNGFSKTLYIECKSGKDSIFWNDGFPSDTTIYLFACRKFGTAKMYMSSDMSTSDDVKYRRTYTDEKNKLNKTLKGLYIESNFNPAVRGAWTQSNIHKLQQSEEQLRNMFDTFLNKPCHTFKRGISLFSGAGGDTMGMEMSGVKVIGFVEKNLSAVSTHNHNFKESVLLGKDITKMKNKIFKQYNGRIDFMFGGFPCQSFSHGGKKDIRDPRGQLYIDFVRAVEHVQPTWVIGENVKGILNRTTELGESMADVVVEAFNKIGYYIQYKLVNVKHFGVPQDRQRVIFVGCKHQIQLQIPETNNTKSKLRDILEFSLNDAIPILPKHTHLINIPREKFICGGDVGSKITGKPPTNLKKCADQKTEKDNITFAKRGKSTYSCIVDIDDISRTLLCTYARMPRLFVPVFINEQNSKFMRPYTILECQRIQGFPDSVEFKGTTMDAITQIGNAVPPPLISSIVSYLDNIPNPPDKLYDYIIDEEMLQLVIECVDDLKFDTTTKLLTFDNESTEVGSCKHPSLIGKLKYEWGICRRKQTAEYSKWLANTDKDIIN